MRIESSKRWFSCGLVLLALSAAYLYGFPSATITYAVVDLLHVAIGILVFLLLLVFLVPLLWTGTSFARAGWILLAAGTLLGLALIKIGTPHHLWNWLYAHIVLCVVGTLLLLGDWLRSKGWLGETVATQGLRFASLVLATFAISAGLWFTREVGWRDARANRIINPLMPPDAMDHEGDGSAGKFFPSSAQTKGDVNIPSQYFMKSDACQRCHADIYAQWNSSMHHFSSFNNQWYRKSIEYMQDVAGVKSSKWCAGGHDPSLLFSGMFDTPIRQIENTPAAKAGLSCLMCHSIVQVKSTMGQGDFTLEYPKLHELAASENPIIRTLHDFVVRLNPEPHRRTFLNPFMRKQTAEFCSTCHKVHLDVPVNSYRWFRGFNEYDNWQASGVSGQGARSFYYPPKPQQCADCHMPAEASKDMGNIAGNVHSHRFPAANTALPMANEDAEQLSATESFLKAGILSVDIFALSPAQAVSKTSAQGESDLSTTFAVGEEAETKMTPGASDGVVAPVTAPLNRAQPALRRGDTVRVDVVVRTKKIGHFFPGGTVDAYDTWLELKGTDDKGQTVFWSGMVEDGGKGPVEKGALFYRSLQIDAHGNPINKRNAWATRAVVYVRLIPPGAADTVHYRIHIPENAGNKITLHARLCYRKFSWYGTQEAFAGLPDPSKPNAVTPDYDDRPTLFTASLRGVSAKEEKIPDLPIVAIT